MQNAIDDRTGRSSDSRFLFRPARKRIVPTLMVCTLLVLTLFLFLPITVLYGNSDWLPISMPTVLWVVAPFALGLFALLVVLCLVLPDQLLRIALSILLALCLLLYLQGNWLVGDYGRFDGADVDWQRNRLQGIVESVVWGAALAFAVLRSQLVLRRVGLVVVLLLLVQVVDAVEYSLTDTRLWRDSSTGSREADLVATAMRDSLLRFSDRSNVVVILLDSLESGIFSKILKESPELEKVLEGFTYYRNTLAPFPTTRAAIPAILTGVTYENRVDIADFLNETFRGQGISDTVARQGFDSTVLTLKVYCEYFTDSTCTTWDQLVSNDSREVVRKHVVQTMDLGLFRFSPHYAKKKLYENHTWFLARLFERSSGRARQWQSIAIAESIAREANLGSERPTFKFIHLDPPHPPLSRNAECRYEAFVPEAATRRLSPAPVNLEEFWSNFSPAAGSALVEHTRCGLSLATMILNRMRALGIYHDAIIVIMSDHGLEWPLGRAMPLLLYKPAAASGSLVVADAPAMLTDLPRSIVTDLGLNTEFPGEDIRRLSPDDPRDRIYRHYMWRHEHMKKARLPPFTRFRVTGHVMDPTSWHVLSNEVD